MYPFFTAINKPSNHPIAGSNISLPAPCTFQAKEAGCPRQATGGGGKAGEGGQIEACARGKIGAAATCILGGGAHL